MTAAALVDRGDLPPGLAIDAADDSPFGEQLRLALMRTRCPLLGAEIFVCIIFERGGQRIFEVPEIGRRDRMPAGANLGLPALLAHGNTATDDFVDVAHGEGNVIDA